MTLLSILALAWGIVLFGGFVLGNERPAQRTPRPARIGSSLLLVISAWGLAWQAHTPSLAQEFGGYALLIACGMTFGFIGDCFLAKLIPISPQWQTVAGMASFGIGHIAYISAIIGLHGQLAAEVQAAALLVWWLIAALGWFAVVYLKQTERSLLHWLALPYSLLLASTAGLGFSAWMVDARLWSLGLGGALFLISDLILALPMFRHIEPRFIHDAVWLTYGPGQMLIVFSTLALL